MPRGSNGRQSKVARLIDEYDLVGMGDELEQRWTRTENRSSLRQLADYFNRQLLQTVIDSKGRRLLDGEINNLYRLLTDEDVTSGGRQDARNRLEQEGIDIEKLENDFVTYQSIRTYLKNYRGVSPSNTQSSPADRIDRRRSSIQRLGTRLVDVTEQSLRELANASILTLGEFEVIVTVRVHCTSCDTQLPVAELLANHGCECQE
jgi:hypothetical protein